MRVSVMALHSYQENFWSNFRFQVNGRFAKSHGAAARCPKAPSWCGLRQKGAPENPALNGSFPSWLTRSSRISVRWSPCKISRRRRRTCWIPRTASPPA
ncbi:protein of unknown function (plasmid) [Rhodovastum atsumiense]|nr:protein of unknown function [Rhodovastum atsumiense]